MTIALTSEQAEEYIYKNGNHVHENIHSQLCKESCDLTNLLDFPKVSFKYLEEEDVNFTRTPKSIFLKPKNIETAQRLVIDGGIEGIFDHNLVSVLHSIDKVRIPGQYVVRMQYQPYAEFIEQHQLNWPKSDAIAFETVQPPDSKTIQGLPNPQVNEFNQNTSSSWIQSLSFLGSSKPEDKTWYVDVMILTKPETMDVLMAIAMQQHSANRRLSKSASFTCA